MIANVMMSSGNTVTEGYTIKQVPGWQVFESNSTACTMNTATGMPAWINDNSTAGTYGYAVNPATWGKFIQCTGNTWTVDALSLGEWKHYNGLGRRDPKDRLREIIQSRMAPAFHRQRVMSAEDIREERARQTLAKVVGPQEFRRFLRRGFVLVRGRSGRVYQIYPGHGKTKVWLHDTLIEELCVVLIGGFPPTDSLIMRALICMNDEADFRKRANVWKAHQTERLEPEVPAQVKTLVEIHRELKSGLAL